MAFDTAEGLREAGVPCRLLLAGPVSSANDHRVLRERLDQAAELAQYFGPVYGEDRRRFFQDIDVFLLPSLYRHETFGLVVGEALVSGCPVVAFENVCLNPAFVGAAGLVLARDQPFAERAVEWIASLQRDPSGVRAALTATAAFPAIRDAARRRAGEVASGMLRGDLECRDR